MTELETAEQNFLLKLDKMQDALIEANNVMDNCLELCEKYLYETGQRIADLDKEISEL